MSRLQASLYGAQLAAQGFELVVGRARTVEQHQLLLLEARDACRVRHHLRVGEHPIWLAINCESARQAEEGERAAAGEREGLKVLT